MRFPIESSGGGGGGVGRVEEGRVAQGGVWPRGPGWLPRG